MADIMYRVFPCFLERISDAVTGGKLWGWWKINGLGVIKVSCVYIEHYNSLILLSYLLYTFYYQKC